MSVDRNNFTVTKWGEKRYAHYCDNCLKFRGYLQAVTNRGRVGDLCVHCKNSGQSTIESGGYCKHCKEKHELPQIGQSNSFWKWEKNSKLLVGGYFRCKEYLKYKANRYIQDHPDKYKLKNRHQSAVRRSLARSTISKLHVKDTMKIYEQAKILEKADGIKREIHHVVPLTECLDIVQGLHVPWNLQILTHVEHVMIHSELNKKEGAVCPS